MDSELLKNTENVVPSLGPLCSDVEGVTFAVLDNATLSRSIVGLALWVNFQGFFFLPSLFSFLIYLRASSLLTETFLCLTFSFLWL